MCNCIVKKTLSPQIHFIGKHSMILTIILRDESLRRKEDYHHVVGGDHSRVLGRLGGCPQTHPGPAAWRSSYVPLQGCHCPQVHRDASTTWLIFIHQGKRTCNICFSSSLASWRVSGSLVETSFTPSMRLVSRNCFFSCSGDDVPL